MIVNGQISVLESVECGFDENRNPIQPIEHWSDNIPCNLKVKKHEFKSGINGNKIEQSSYEILIEGTEITALRVRVATLAGFSAELEVEDIQILHSVNRIKIIA